MVHILIFTLPSCCLYQSFSLDLFSGDAAPPWLIYVPTGALYPWYHSDHVGTLFSPLLVNTSGESSVAYNSERKYKQWRVSQKAFTMTAQWPVALTYHWATPWAVTCFKLVSHLMFQEFIQLCCEDIDATSRDCSCLTFQRIKLKPYTPSPRISISSTWFETGMGASVMACCHTSF